MNYIANTMVSESGQGMIISCFFQIKNYELQNKTAKGLFQNQL